MVARIGKFRVVGSVAKARVRAAKGACEERKRLDVLVELGGESSPFDVVGLIPAGACNVLMSGRVVEAVTVQGGGDASVDVGVSLSSPSLVATDYFGSVDGSEGDTFTPADMDDSSSLSSGVGFPLVYQAAGDVTFTAGAAFTAGVIRLAIFFTLVGAPTR